MSDFSALIVCQLLLSGPRLRQLYGGLSAVAAEPPASFAALDVT